MIRESTTSIALATALILGGCASSASQRPTSSAPGRPDLPANSVAVTATSNGSHVSLDVGQVLVVELPENPSRGHTWQLAAPMDQTVVMPDGQRFVESSQQQADGSLVGTQQLRFAAVGPGESVIDLALVRPGAGIASAVERWIVQVIVR
ncbi:MAG: protease inhibitor I42 family protein [Phycisphaerales bacterium]|nr:protease inhibitor I42 family protein [Phycisphaerales bacterium]